MSRRSLSLPVLAVGLAAATLLAVVGGGPAPPTGASPRVVRVGQAIDSRLREAAAGLHSRATTLADLPRLGAAVATDAATVQDLTQEELAFRLKKGETIEIGQITKGGKAVLLLRIPKDSPVGAPLAKPGVSLRPGTPPILSEVVSIQPTVTTDIQSGAVAVSWQVDLPALAAELDGLHAAGRIEIGHETVAATGTLPADAQTLSVPLAFGAALIVDGTAAGSVLSSMRLLAIVVAIAALVVAAILWRRPSASSGRSDLPAPTTNAAVTPMLPDPAAILPTTSFGRYQLVRKLGSGGMAEVYLARVVGEAGFLKDVALKIMHRSFAGMPEIVDHFLDEARLATRLNHPNIVQIIDLGRQDDDYFIAMEYVNGYDLDYLLDSCMRRGVAVPLRIALAVVRKICDGLHAAHMAIAFDGRPLDLVHRDVKAENVLISRKGEVKVADFGIAKANQRTRQTQLGMVKGTAAYMAPEHRAGKPVDIRADVYGVGAILYEMLAGYQVNLDLEKLAHMGIVGWPHLRSLTQVRFDLPPDVDALVFRALAYDRNDRYPTCAEFENAIEAFATRYGVVIGDKVLVQWIEAQIAASESAPAAAPVSGGAPT